jgi:hypothetical protein
MSFISVYSIPIEIFQTYIIDYLSITQWRFFISTGKAALPLRKVTFCMNLNHETSIAFLESYSSLSQSSGKNLDFHRKVLSCLQTPKKQLSLFLEMTSNVSPSLELIPTTNLLYGLSLSGHHHSSPTKEIDCIYFSSLSSLKLLKFNKIENLVFLKNLHSLLFVNVSCEIDCHCLVGNNLMKVSFQICPCLKGIEKLKNVKSLSFLYCYNVTCIDSLTHVKRLSTKGCKSLSTINTLLSSVYSLDLSDCRDFSNSSLSSLSKVRKLSLSFCFLLQDISPVASVYYLDLSYCMKITDVSSLKNVHTLILRDCSGICDVSSLTNVKVLDVSHCRNILEICGILSTSSSSVDTEAGTVVYSSSSSSKDPEVTTEVKGLRKIITLKADYCFSLQWLKGSFPTLKRLSLIGCQEVQDLSVLEGLSTSKTKEKETFLPPSFSSFLSLEELTFCECCINFLMKYHCFISREKQNPMTSYSTSDTSCESHSDSYRSCECHEFEEKEKDNRQLVVRCIISCKCKVYIDPTHKSNRNGNYENSGFNV